VAKHPARCPRCGNRLEVDTAVDERIICPECGAPFSSINKAEFPVKTDPLIGQTLGQFEIVDLLGRGGMGAVYKARQASLDRMVAIKVLPRRFSRNARFVARFDREARAAAAISHRNIIEIYDVGQDRGYHFIAMEFIDGENLADVLKREGRLPAGRALRLMRQVVAALAAAGEAGIVHRDIKPSNILIDSMGIAKVADFGLAKRPGTDVSVTATGAALGTPLYMPPEAAQGTALDARSDLYSLGATFYHVLAGRPPFQAASSPELILKHATQRPEPLGAVAPDIDPRLPHIIDRLLRKNPSARYPSAQALLDELDAIAEAPARRKQRVEQRATTATARPRPTERATDRSRRARLPSRATLIGGIMGAAALLAIILVLVIARSRPRRQPAPRPVHTTDRAKAAFDAAAAYGAEHPDDLDAAIARYRSVQAKYPGSAWATRAASKLQRLGRKKSQLAARTEAERQLDREIADLRSQCNTLTSSDQFGRAVARIEDFAERYPSGKGAAEAAKLRDAVLAEADQRYEGLSRIAAAALEHKELDKAREALRAALASGIDAITRKAEARLKRIDAIEKAAREHWEAALAAANEAMKNERYDEAIRQFQQGKDSPIEAIRKRVPELIRKAEQMRHEKATARRDTYAKQSDRIWTLLRERQYAQAEKLCAELSANPDYKAAASHLHADAEAARLLTRFWDAVEKGLLARKGRRAVIGGVGGTVAKVANGVVTLQVGSAEARAAWEPIARFAEEPLTDERAAKLAKMLDQLEEKHDAARLPSSLKKAIAEARERIKGLQWVDLFDGKGLDGWRIVKDFRYTYRHYTRERKMGKVHCKDGQLILEATLRPDFRNAAAVWTRSVPKDNYEVLVEGEARGGTHLGMVLPVGESHFEVTVYHGGGHGASVWLGQLDGVEGHRAGAYHRYQKERSPSYRLSVHVGPNGVYVTVDGERLIEVERGRYDFSASPFRDRFKPFGLWAHQGPWAVRSLRLRRIEAQPPRIGHPPEIQRQMDEIHAALKAKNPAYNGKCKFAFRDGKLQILCLNRCNLHDLSPVLTLDIEYLMCCENELTDLSSLKGASLKSLECSNNRIRDLSPLKGMPLTSLTCRSNRITDLTPVADMPELQILYCSDNPITRLPAFKSTKLVSIDISNTRITDLGPLRGVRMSNWLYARGLAIKDLSVVNTMSLWGFAFTPKKIKGGIDVLRQHKNLKYIAAQGFEDRHSLKFDEFWRAWDQRRRK